MNLKWIFKKDRLYIFVNDVKLLHTYLYIFVQHVKLCKTLFVNLITQDSGLYRDEVTEETSQDKANKAFRTKNIHFNVWLSHDLGKWFYDHLNRVSYGETLSAKFRVLLYALQKIEEKGITILNPSDPLFGSYLVIFSAFLGIGGFLVLVSQVFPGRSILT